MIHAVHLNGGVNPARLPFMKQTQPLSEMFDLNSELARLPDREQAVILFSSKSLWQYMIILLPRFVVLLFKTLRTDVHLNNIKVT